MYGIVPAAGRGTRLRPATDDRPKALVEVGGRPLLSHALETLAPHVEAVAVVVGYHRDQIRGRYGASHEGTPLRYVEQTESEGLADAVLQGRPGVDGSFLQLEGDNVLRGNVCEVLETHLASGADATLLVDRVAPERTARGGVLKFEDGEVVDLVEKPDDPPSRLATTGCFAVSPRVFETCRAIYRSERGEYGLVDAVHWLLEGGGAVETVRVDAWRLNVNAPEDVERAGALP